MGLDLIEPCIPSKFMATRLIHENTVFLHIPKTGGVWVERALREAGIPIKRFGHEHGTYDRMLEEEMTCDGYLPSRLARRIHRGLRRMGREPAPPRRFCFVRNPLKWYESFWRYKMDLKWEHWGRENYAAYWHPNSALNGLDSDDFNEFMWKVVMKRPGYASELMMRFASTEIDIVGRTEYLADDLVEILKRLGIAFNEERLRNARRTNESQTPSSLIQWDPKLRELVTRFEYPALVHFGYIADEKIDASKMPASDFRHRGLLLH